MPIDGPALEIRRYDPTLHDRKNFDCGHNRLNNFLRLNAKKQQNDDMSRIYVALNVGETKILGYSAINVGRIDAGNLEKKPRGTPAHGEIPALLLGQIAVDKGETGAGIGSILMYHVFEKAVGVADAVGCYAIVLDVVSDDGEAAYNKRLKWYGDFGFLPFPSSNARLFMPMQNVRDVVGVELDQGEH